MGSFLETVMLICFGISWPINLMKNIRAKTARSMSLGFILLIVAGYVAGIAAKIIIYQQTGTIVWYVMVVYILNLLMVSANIFVYFHNRKLDRAAGK